MDHFERKVLRIIIFKAAYVVLPSSKLTWQWKFTFSKYEMHPQMVGFPLLCQLFHFARSLCHTISFLRFQSPFVFGALLTNTSKAGRWQKKRILQELGSRDQGIGLLPEEKIALRREMFSPK